MTWSKRILCWALPIATRPFKHTIFGGVSQYLVTAAASASMPGKRERCNLLSHYAEGNAGQET